MPGLIYAFTQVTQVSTTIQNHQRATIAFHKDGFVIWNSSRRLSSMQPGISEENRFFTKFKAGRNLLRLRVKSQEMKPKRGTGGDSSQVCDCIASIKQNSTDFSSQAQMPGTLTRFVHE
jgi:hypothetical protein